MSLESEPEDACGGWGRREGKASSTLQAHTHKAPRYWHVRLESERLKQKGKKNVTKISHKNSKRMIKIQ